MAALDERRERTLQRLCRHFSAGHVRQGTLEHRVEAAMRAQSKAGLHAAVWDLPPLRPSLWQTVAARLSAQECSRMSIRAAEEIVLYFEAGPCTWLVGRSSACDVVLRDPLISRRHALVSVRGGRVSIRDLGSTNGVAVNGVRVATARLHPGDLVSFGGAIDALVR